MVYHGDPRIKDWFKLVGETQNKEDILYDEDIWTFDTYHCKEGDSSANALVTDTEWRNAKAGKWTNDSTWVSVFVGVSPAGHTVSSFIVSTNQQRRSHVDENADLMESWGHANSSEGQPSSDHNLDWLKHFDKHTRETVIGNRGLLVLAGNQTPDFHRYCEENYIVALCIPAHAERVLHPMELHCTLNFKRIYKQYVKDWTRKVGAQQGFQSLRNYDRLWFTTFGHSNIEVVNGFRDSGIFPFNPEVVLLKIGGGAAATIPKALAQGLQILRLPWPKTMSNKDQAR